jgi:hypothetical protein
MLVVWGYRYRVPAVGWLPDHPPPDAVQLVALVTVHCRVIPAPSVIVVGRTVMVTRMVKNLKPSVIHGQQLSPSGGPYPKEALRVGTLRRFLAGLLQSTVAQLSADPKIGTSFDFLDEEFEGL